MVQQAGSPTVFENSNVESVCMDGERPTMIRGVRPTQRARTTECLSPPSYLAGGPTVRQRLVAGLWFGAAAAFPGFLVLVCGGSGRNSNIGWELLAMLLLMPAVVGGICGAWVGPRILTYTGVDAGGEAFKIGAKVTFLSMLGISAVVATGVALTSHDGGGALETWFGMFLAMAFSAVVFTGWLLIPFGGMIGCALQCLSEWDQIARAPRYQPPTAHPNPAPLVDNRTLSFPASRLPVSPGIAVTLQNCSDCGRIVSRAAVSCPRCGHLLQAVIW